MIGVIIMEELTIIFLVAALMAFVVAVVAKNRVLWFFDMILSVVALCLILQDSTVPADNLILFLIPVVFTTLIDVSGFTFIAEGERNA